MTVDTSFLQDVFRMYVSSDYAEKYWPRQDIENDILICVWGGVCRCETTGHFEGFCYVFSLFLFQGKE